MNYQMLKVLWAIDALYAQPLKRLYNLIKYIYLELLKKKNLMTI